MTLSKALKAFTFGLPVPGTKVGSSWNRQWGGVVNGRRYMLQDYWRLRLNQQTSEINCRATPGRPQVFLALIRHGLKRRSIGGLTHTLGQEDKLWKPREHIWEPLWNDKGKPLPG